MAWSFTSGTAVYLQIADRIIKSILSGEYSPGQQLPTVRQLALEAAVNPNTVQRAFTELESDGIIISKGTSGRFVTQDTEIIEQCRQKMARRIVLDFLKNAKQLSLTKEQLIEMIKEVTT